MKTDYDVVVVGAGSGGLTAAVGFSKMGKRVLLVEREHMGGECTNSGCVPSKALLHAGRAGMSGGEAFAYVRQTVDGILAEETPEVFEKLGIDVVMGEAQFVRKCAVRVSDVDYEYKTAVIATGSSPRMIDVDGLDEQDVLTNQNIFDLQDVPDKLLIIGGGPIGLEMAQAFAMLGSQVTIAERDETFARLEDEAIRPIVRRHLEELGVVIETGASIQRVEGGEAVFDHMHGDQVTREFRVPFDKVLIAIGRTPNLPPGLGAAGITHTPHGIDVDRQHRTGNKYVYAVGDVAQRLKFTHTADDVARQVVTRVASKGWLRFDTKKAVPKVTYTTPEIAQVGLSWPEAIAKYGDDRLMRIEVPYDNSDRAKTDNTTDGLLVVIARRLGGQVLGAHIVGPRAGETIAVFSLAIDHKISLWKLQKHIFAYPTYNLIAKKAGDQFVGRQLGSLKSDLFAVLRRNAAKLIAISLWIGTLYALRQYQVDSGLSTTQTAVRLFEFITLTAWGPLLYVVLYAVRPVTFFPAAALTILSGIFFGVVWGTILTVVAATLAGGVAYVIGRFFGANLTLQDSALGSWVTALQNNTFSAVLTTRLTFLPFDLVSYAAGILRTPFMPFILATLVGIPLGTATYVAIGASLNTQQLIEQGVSFDIIEPQFLLLSGAILVVSLVLSKVLQRWKTMR